MRSIGVAMAYRVRHRTRYDYGDTVALSHHILHLTPRDHPFQQVRTASLSIDPHPAIRTDRIDFFGNPTTYAAIQVPHRTLLVEAAIDIAVAERQVWEPSRTPSWEEVGKTATDIPATADGGLPPVAFGFASLFVPTDPAVAAFAGPSFTPGRPVGEVAIDLMHRIHREFVFDPAATTVATPLSEVLGNRRGVCQDFAHLQIACLRAFRIPARYVSGYLRTIPPPGQPRLIGADASHAWIAVWCGDRWVDLDPTNGRIADTDYVTLAWGRDYDDVSPVRGVLLGGADHALSVEVDVLPL